MMSNAEKRFIDELVSQVPEFKEKYEDHVQFYGEILPIVLMDEFSRFLLEHFRTARASPGSPSDGLVARALNYLETALEEKNEEVETIIRTTFSESVDAEWRDKDFVSALLKRSGPNLRKTISAVQLGRKSEREGEEKG